jgi:hypothetical protein
MRGAGADGRDAVGAGARRDAAIYAARRSVSQLPMSPLTVAS